MCRLLVARGVSAATSKAVAKDVVNECGDYLVGVRHGYTDGSDVLEALRAFLTKATSQSIDLRNVLEGCGATTLVGFTRDDRRRLLASLDQLVDAATGFQGRVRPRKGKRPDLYRRQLEERIAFRIDDRDEVNDQIGEHTAGATSGLFTDALRERANLLGFKREPVVSIDTAIAARDEVCFLFGGRRSFRHDYAASLGLWVVEAEALLDQAQGA